MSPTAPLAHVSHRAPFPPNEKYFYPQWVAMWAPCGFRCGWKWAPGGLRFGVGSRWALCGLRALSHAVWSGLEIGSRALLYGLGWGHAVLGRVDVGPRRFGVEAL